MKKKTALIGVCTIAASTIGLTFIQPTIIHQLVIWVAGLFALLVVLAVFAVDHATEGDSARAAAQWSAEDSAVILAVRGMREQHMRDETISRMLNIDIDVIKAIPR